MEHSNMLFSKADIRRLMLPLILEQMLSYMVGLADTVMVSSAGNEAVAAVSLVDSISTLMIMIFSALAGGGASIAGQYLGRKEEDKARSAGEQLFFMLLLTSVLITGGLLIFENAVLGLLFGKVEPAVRLNCSIYYRILMVSTPFLALFNGAAALFRTSGDSRTPVKIAFLMNGINVAGNAILIYGFHLGVAGVAIPSLISRFVAMSIILSMTFRPTFILHLRGVRHPKFNGSMIRNILSIAIPSGAENGMFQFGKILLISLVATMPTASITANAIGNTMGSVHNVIGISCGIGLITLVSRSVGAGDYKQARWYTEYVCKWVYVVQGILNVIMILTIPLICRAYGVTGETARLTTQILFVHSMTTLTMYSPAFLLSGAMRSAGDSTYTMIGSSVAMWVGRVFMSYLLILGFGFGVLSIWIAWGIDWIIRICFFVPRWRGHKWETKAVKS